MKMMFTFCFTKYFVIFKTHFKRIFLKNETNLFFRYVSYLFLLMKYDKFYPIIFIGNAQNDHSCH